MTLTSLLNYVLQRKYILMALLSLEAAILSLALLVTLSLSASPFGDLFLCLVILTLGACEASVALAILVLMTRSYGSDMIKSLSSNKC
uniref:NADH-ubiquinone oxidoreductase chain 4L n=1 Tax=Marenzelleria neglecta TaxID=361650 RepID=A0A5Q0U0A0_MARNE|nr:NADH dehydrogenase subunit 4L [Marenzelleria neglecta]